MRIDRFSKACLYIVYVCSRTAVNVGIIRIYTCNVNGNLKHHITSIIYSSIFLCFDKYT